MIVHVFPAGFSGGAALQFGSIQKNFLQFLLNSIGTTPANLV